MFGTTWCIFPEGNYKHSLIHFASRLINESYKEVFMAYFEGYYGFVKEKQGVGYALENCLYLYLLMIQILNYLFYVIRKKQSFIHVSIKS